MMGLMPVPDDDLASLSGISEAMVEDWQVSPGLAV